MYIYICANVGTYMDPTVLEGSRDFMRGFLSSTWDARTYFFDTHTRTKPGKVCSDTGSDQEPI